MVFQTSLVVVETWISQLRSSLRLRSSDLLDSIMNNTVKHFSSPCGSISLRLPLFSLCHLGETASFFFFCFNNQQNISLQRFSCILGRSE